MSRPILPWRSPLEFLPSLKTDVWIRRLPWYDKPLLAQYAPDGFFEINSSQGAPPSSLTLIGIPQYLVHTWKYRFLADEHAQFPPS
jgi:hypothetical protein